MQIYKDVNECYAVNPQTIEGELDEIGGSVLRTTGLTDIELVKNYDKVITARIDGEWVGWGCAIDFIKYYCNSGKHKKNIKDVTYWGNIGCRNHWSLQYCLQCVPIDEIVNDDLLSKEEYKNWIAYRYGKKLPRVGRLLEIKCKSLNNY